MAGALWAKWGERDISRGARHERFSLPLVRASRSCRAPHEISRSPRLAHKLESTCHAGYVRTEEVVISGMKNSYLVFCRTNACKKDDLSGSKSWNEAYSNLW